MQLSHEDALLLVDALYLLEQTYPADSKRAAQCRMLAAEIATQFNSITLKIPFQQQSYRHWCRL